MRPPSLTILFSIAGTLVLALSAAVNAAERPNIVVILADDMGYGDVQALNPASRIPTPNLNRLAAEGMTCTDAHSPSAVCTPTRYALLTGRYCWRSPLKSGVLNGYSAPLIERDRPTIATHLSQHGYETGIVGKWHLGLGFQRADDQWDWKQALAYSPVDAGFQSSFVIPASLDFPPYVYVKDHRITGLPDRTQPAQPFPAFLRQGELGADMSIIDCLDELTTNAVAFIREQSKTDSPFFLYFPLSAPHKPVQPHPRFRGRSGLGPYGDFVMQVDWTVGQILEALEEAGVAENTVVFYTSDNGSFMYRQTSPTQPDHVADASVQAYYEGHHTANGPFRGTKADIWEGGHRVPFFVRWPGRIAAGSSSAHTVCQVDLFATASALAGISLPAATEAAPDSFNLLPLLLGEDQKWRRAPVIHHSGNGMFAIRDGDWKLVLGNGSGGREQPRGNRFEGPFQLYNLAEDPGETRDRLISEAEIAQRLEAQMLKILADDQSR